MQLKHFRQLRMSIFLGALLSLAVSLSYIKAEQSNSDLDRALARIKPEWIKSHVQFLAHDLLRGRGTGDIGYEIAKEYVAAQFLHLGLKPIDKGSYFQSVDILVGGKDLGSEVAIGSITLRSPEALFTPAWLDSRRTISGEGVYVGYGLVSANRDDYAGIDVKGKIVFILMGMPPDWPEEYDNIVLGRAKNELPLRRGAFAVIGLQIEKGRRGGGQQKALFDGKGPARPDVIIGPEASQRLLAAWGVDLSTAEKQSPTMKRAQSVGNVTIRRTHEMSQTRTWNVIGVLEGNDPALKKEAVVFVAHLDALGLGQPDNTGDSIFNGARDNAIGVGKMLAAAEALTQLKLRRSVVFVALGSEEGGLLGSWYYVHHPVFSLSQTVAGINLDDGRTGEASEDVATFGNQFSVVLDQMLRQAAQETEIKISSDRRPPLAPSALFSSDHYSFLVAGVPTVYLMDGYTVGGDPDLGQKEWADYVANSYHKQSDNFDQGWSFKSAAQMAKLTARLVWLLANQDQKPKINSNAPVVLQPRF